LIGAGVPDAEVVLAGDVFYSAPVARRMLAFLRLCRDAGLAVLIGDPGRVDLPTDSLCLVSRYDVSDVGGGQATPSAVYTLRPA
jgi:predicted nicotinamide N-methyase